MVIFSLNKPNWRNISCFKIAKSGWLLLGQLILSQGSCPGLHESLHSSIRNPYVSPLGNLDIIRIIPSLLHPISFFVFHPYFDTLLIYLTVKWTFPLPHAKNYIICYHSTKYGLRWTLLLVLLKVSQLPSSQNINQPFSEFKKQFAIFHIV